MPATSTPPSTIEADACYLALKARDARFDGSFFTGVTSTGIYCRPVCKVRAPRRENCRFFTLAAQAERDGFRPCLRCRPELAPHALAWSIQDASAILAGQAARLLDDPNAWGGDSASVQALAARLGVSDRHVRRIFEQHLGVTPVQYLQTRRLLSAKQLLADTPLPITRIAFLSGYASVRRFNAAFLQHYGLNPGRLRASGGAWTEPGAPMRLGYRPPYDIHAMLAFFRTRALQQVEWVSDDPKVPALARTVRLQLGAQTHSGWMHASFDETRCQLLLRVSDSLLGALPLLLPRVRAMFDLDADPQAIHATLQGAFPQGAGLRVPGAWDGHELAVRAVLGQQITVAAARTLAQRLVERFGEDIATPIAGLSRLFPSAQILASLDPSTLGALGIVRQRQGAIIALSRAVADGRLQLFAGANWAATVAALKELPGIGDWTAQYIAMRALRWPDAFPAGDVALHKVLGLDRGKQPAKAAELASQAWRPWRSYAVIRAWHQPLQAAPA
jgi:AraC family transcriptional regulator of adaptative response / DNA-3-methyladenine glycosylase II